MSWFGKLVSALREAPSSIVSKVMAVVRPDLDHAPAPGVVVPVAVPARPSSRRQQPPPPPPSAPPQVARQRVALPPRLQARQPVSASARPAVNPIKHYRITFQLYGAELAVRPAVGSGNLQVNGKYYQARGAMYAISSTTVSLETLRKRWLQKLVYVYSDFSRNAKTDEWDELLEDLAPNLDMSKSPEEAKSLFIKVALGYELDDDVSYVKVLSIEPDLGDVKFRDDQRLVDRRFANGDAVKAGDPGGARFIYSPYVKHNYTYDESKVGLDYIFTDPYKAECIPTWMNGGGCAIKCILLQFKEGWDKYQNSLARSYKIPLTAESLIELFDAKPPEYAVSIAVMVKKFFEPFGLQLRVYDRDTIEIFRFDPKKQCRKFGSVLSVIAFEGHFFRINTKISQLSAKTHDLKRWEEVASSSFRLPLVVKKGEKKKKEEDEKSVGSQGAGEAKKKTKKKKEKDPPPPKICLFIPDVEKLSGVDFTLPGDYTITTETKITHLLKYLWTEMKVRPEIVSNGTDLISSITVLIGGSTVRFVSLENNAILRALNFKDQAQFETYNSYSDRQRKAFLTEMNKSNYSEDWVVNAFNTCPKALMGRVAEGVATDVADVVKCYTKSVLSLKRYLVASNFDRWQIYNGAELEDNDFYTLCRDVEVPLDSLMWVFLNQAKVSYPGYILMTKVDGEKTVWDLLKPYAHIGYWCPISNTRKTVGEWKKVINEMYSEEASKKVGATTHSQNKISTNLIVGLAERVVNRKSVSALFGNRREAIEYCQKINELSPDTNAFCFRFYGIDSVGNFAGEDYDPAVEGETTSNEKMMEALGNPDETEQIWIVCKKSSAPMINGFYPIKMQIYAEGRLQLYQLCKHVVKKGGMIVGVKTDAVYYKRAESYTPVLSGKIGEYTDRPLRENDTVPENKWRENEDAFKPFVPTGVALSELASEEKWCEEGGGALMVREAMSVCGSYLVPRCMITADTAGAGKTWLGLELVKESVRTDKTKCVLASLSNRRKNELKRDLTPDILASCEVCTIHHLLGIRMDDDKETERVCMMDLTTVGLLMIDEIYLLNTKLLGKLVKLLARYPHVKVIATGDALQQRIDDIKVKDNTKYMEEVMAGIFPNGIKLRVNKRLKSAVDRMNVMEVKQSLLVRGDETWRKYVGEMKTIAEVIRLVKKDGSKLIAYTQKKRRELNELVHHSCLVGGEIAVGVFQLRVGLKLTVKRRVIIDKVIIHCGEEGEVSSVDAGGVELTFEDGRVVRVGNDLFGTYNSFDYSYCNTAVATQGDTYDCGVIIFETDHFGMSNNAIYTSITRPRSLSQAWVWRGDELEGEMTFLGVKKGVEDRIRGHKVADREAGRLFIDGKSYVDYGWVKEKMAESDVCWCCSNKMTWDSDDEESCLSIDRIDDSKAHTKVNCRLGCRACNKGHQNNAVDPEEVEDEDEPAML